MNAQKLNRTTQKFNRYTKINRTTQESNQDHKKINMTMKKLNRTNRKSKQDHSKKYTGPCKK